MGVPRRPRRARPHERRRHRALDGRDRKDRLRKKASFFVLPFSCFLLQSRLFCPVVLCRHGPVSYQEVAVMRKALVGVFAIGLAAASFTPVTATHRAEY